ncbi:ankyrin repeat protein [Colletotrichum kahawae]|uniref:Ankyrin repeat protein n=1 Tax=Colletotrichum kahawae TaxID=34407 RepID=A0AAD9YNP4_COLKA|nr:ankyrin repeat protein [Colletotrichum kahawae]
MDHAKRNYPDKLNVTLPHYWDSFREEGDSPPPITLAALQNLTPCIDGYTAIQAAIVTENHQFVKRLLEEGADAALENAQPCWSCSAQPGRPPHLDFDFEPYNAAKTPLHTAICYGQFEAATELLKFGASSIVFDGDLVPINATCTIDAWRAPHSGNERSVSVLHDLCHVYMPGSGTINIARLVLERGITSITDQTSWGEQALPRACRTGQFRYANWLAQQPNVDVHAPVPWRSTETLLLVVLETAVRCWSYPTHTQAQKDALQADFNALPQLVNTLIQSGIDVDAKRPDGSTAAHLCARLGGDATQLEDDDASIIQQLVDSNADISIKDGDQLTALDVVKRFHSPLFGLSRSHSLAPLSDGGQQSQGHIPAKFVPLLEEIRFTMDDFDFGGSFHIDENENRRFFLRSLRSTTSRDIMEALWWVHDPNGPEGHMLRSWSSKPTGHHNIDHRAELPIQAIEQLYWSAEGPRRVILSLTTGILGRSGKIQHDQVFVQFGGDEGGDDATYHFRSFLSWSLAFISIMTKVSSATLSRKWNSRTGR